MSFNPDPDRYVLKVRRGKVVLVDKQILRWRKRRKKEEARAIRQIEREIAAYEIKKKLMVDARIDGAHEEEVKRGFAEARKKLFGAG